MNKDLFCLVARFSEDPKFTRTLNEPRGKQHGLRPIDARGWCVFVIGEKAGLSPGLSIHLI